MAARTFKRDKFQERLLNEINVILRNLSDKRLQFVSITKVECNHDYSNAVVYWDTYDASKRGDVKKASKVRSLLSSKLKIRHIPSLTFKYDSQFESEQVIDKILREEKNAGKHDSKTPDDQKLDDNE